MFIKKVNFLVCLALALVCGFGLSFLVGANVDEGMTSGDISKANLYNKQMPDPESSVIEELLRNDPDYLMATQSDLSIIKERVMILDELTKKTLKSCTKLPEFEDLMLTVSSLQAKAFNTNLAVDAANKGLEEILNGKSSPEYEVSSNNAYLGFEKIGNQLAIGQAILEATARYSENNEGETADSLATLAADWMVYCYDNAAVNGLDDKLASLEELMNSSDVANLGMRPAVCKNLIVVQKQAAVVGQKQAEGVVQKQAAVVGQKLSESVAKTVKLSSKNVEGVLGKNINYANKRAGEQN
ncbi:MAG: hypothetical protein MJY96_04650 [Bacteroidaceae bacterium]|nr:hypothetical protein [Bacteroidaceae bacterium]